MSFYIHPTAEVSPEAVIGQGTRIWHQAQVRQGVQIGDECIIGKGAYIDFNVVIGHRCKLQNGVYVYHGATIEDGVFLGPGVMVLNDKNPRAITVDGALKSDADWQVSLTHIGYGAGVGGGAIILPGISIGQWAIIGSGAVVTRDIPDYGLAYGNPARLTGFVCPCGQRLAPAAETAANLENQADINLICPQCHSQVTIPAALYRQAQ
jgi:UDP-2-acetamido-3-amino-2,3-dideoxy-glucuronate N-acetyltransferase